MRVCKRCSAEFDARGCPACASTRTKTWRALNPERAKERSAAYRAANPEKLKAYAEAYRAECPEKNAAYRAANAEKLRAYQANYRVENPEKVRACMAAWWAANKEKARVNQAAYKAANPEKIRAYEHNRRARLADCEGSHTGDDVKNLYKLQKGMCVSCRADISGGYHEDHIISLVNGGSNDIYNIQLLCAPCNLSKHAKDPIEFMQSKGFLL